MSGPVFNADDTRNSMRLDDEESLDMGSPDAGSLADEGGMRRRTVSPHGEASPQWVTPHDDSPSTSHPDSQIATSPGDDTQWSQHDARSESRTPGDSTTEEKILPHTVPTNILTPRSHRSSPTSPRNHGTYNDPPHTQIDARPSTTTDYRATQGTAPQPQLSLQSLNTLRVFITQIILVPYFTSIEDALTTYFHNHPIVQSNFFSFATDLLLLSNYSAQINALFAELIDYLNVEHLTVSQFLQLLRTQSTASQALMDLYHCILKEYSSIGAYEQTLSSTSDVISSEIATNTLTGVVSEQIAPIFQAPYFTMERIHFVSLLRSVDELFLIQDSYRVLKQMLQQSITQDPTSLSKHFPTRASRSAFCQVISSCYPSVKVQSINYLFNQSDMDADGFVEYVEVGREIFGDAPHPQVVPREEASQKQQAHSVSTSPRLQNPSEATDHNQIAEPRIETATITPKAVMEQRDIAMTPEAQPQNSTPRSAPQQSPINSPSTPTQPGSARNVPAPLELSTTTDIHPTQLSLNAIVAPDATPLTSPSRQSQEKKYLPGTAPESQLHVAARNGNVDEVRDLLQRGVIYRRTVDGISPLWIACQEGHYEIAHELVISGSDVNEPSNTGATPLLVAAQYGHAHIVRFLLENGANVNTRQNTQETALMLAAEEGHTEVVQELLTYNALVNAKDNDGVTALHISSLFGHIDVVRELISHNAFLNELDNDGSTPLFLACEAGHFQCVTVLLQAGASSRISDQTGTTCLHIASQEGHLDIVRLLLQDGVDPNIITSEGATPLILAIQENHSDVVQELIHFGANPNIEHKGVPPLIVATHRGHDVAIKMLCNAGANVNCRLRTGEAPLFIAAERGFLEGVRVLLQYGANPNTGSSEVGTPLFVACYKGHVKIVRELIRYEADLEYAEADGTTALIMAVETGNLEVVRELVKAYANVNAFTNTDGNAPLHLVAQRGDVEMAKILTNGGTNVNQVNAAGDTPLIIAVRNGHFDIVQLLLSFSVHVNTANKMGETALFAASQKEDLKLFRLLIRKRFGADINLPLNDGTTILSKACADGHYELVRLIVEAKLNSVSYPVDLNKIGHEGMTPLQHAVQVEHIEIVKLLLLAGVDIGKLSDEGKTAYDISHNERIRDLLMMHSNGEPRKSTSHAENLSSPKSNGYRPPNMYIAMAKDDDDDHTLHTPTQHRGGTTPSQKLQLYDQSDETAYILKAPHQRYRADNNMSSDTIVAQFTGLQQQLVEQFSFQNQQLLQHTSELKLQMQQQMQFQQEQMKLQTKQMEILERLSHRVAGGGAVDSDNIESLIEKKLDSVLGRILQKQEQSPRRRSPSSMSRSLVAQDSYKYFMDENLDDDEDPQKILDAIPTPRYTYNDPVPSPQRDGESLQEEDTPNSIYLPPLDIQSGSNGARDSMGNHSVRSRSSSTTESVSGSARSRNHRLIL